MESVIGLAALLALVIAAAVFHQRLLDARLFEPGGSEVPEGGDRSAAEAVVRCVLAGAVPLVATIAAAVLVVTMPFRIWVWGVVHIASEELLFRGRPALAGNDTRDGSDTDVSGAGGRTEYSIRDTRRLRRGIPPTKPRRGRERRTRTRSHVPPRRR